MNLAISRRLAIGSTALVFAFLAIAGLSLEQAFRESTDKALRAQLEAHVYLLLATADEDALGRPRLPELLSAPGFNRPDSGLYASVSGSEDNYSWQSASLLGRQLIPAPSLPVGESALAQRDDLLVLHQGIGWDDLSGNSLPYVFSVAMDSRPLEIQQQSFRLTLWGWLGGLGLVLIGLQLFLVNWGLRPLRRIADQVQQIEQGERESIPGPVPRELRPLTDNLNSLIRQTQGRQEQLRNALADLAHSLKTPLAVLRGLGRQHADGQLASQVDEQTERIDQIVSYQRQRLSVVGGSSLLPQQPVLPILQRVCDALRKAHHAKQMNCRISVPEDFHWRVEQGDLFELFGNLLDNAFKYGHKQVVVRAEDSALLFEDDGAGFEPAQAQRLLQRGQRGDQVAPGEGIGLAVVQEIVTQYAGKLEISLSSIGGACVRLQLDD